MDPQDGSPDLPGMDLQISKFVSPPSGITTYSSSRHAEVSGALGWLAVRVAPQVVGPLEVDGHSGLARVGCDFGNGRWHSAAPPVAAPIVNLLYPPPT